MDSQHRHDLKTNDLAKSLMTAQDYVREYGGRVALGLAIVVLAIVLIFQRAHRSRTDALRYQTNIAVARTVIERLNNVQVNFEGRVSPEPTDPAIGDARRLLQDVRENASDKRVLAQAVLAQGDLAWGMANYPDVSAASTRPLAKPENSASEYLNDARAAYQQVLAQFADQTIPATAARFGLAAVAENEGKWDEARTQYQAVKGIADVGEAFKRLADQKLKQLEDLHQPVLIGQVPEKFELPQLPSSSTTQSAATTQTTTQHAAATTRPAGAAPTTKPAAPTTRPAGK